MTPQARISQARTSQSGAAQAQPPQSETNPLVEFVALESAIRRAGDIDELRAVLCNSARKTLGYRQAFLLECRAAGWRVVSVSSVSSIDAHAPLLRAIAGTIDKSAHSQGASYVDLAASMSQAGIDQAAYPFAHGLAVTLNDTEQKPFACLLFARERPWREMDEAMAQAVAETASHAWRALEPNRKSTRDFPRRRLAIATCLMLILTSIVPVRLTALAPAEVVARNPVVVAAPLDGVVATLPVAPNSRVESGDIVLTFVDTKIRNDAELAERGRAVAAAKLHRVVQSSFGAPKDAHEIAIARAELALAEAEATRSKELLERSVVRAEKPGILVYSAPEDWIGKPLSTGERIMDIVDPAFVELRVDLAIADALALQKGAPAKFFPDGNPLDSRNAILERTGYRATSVGEGMLAYRNFARFEGQEDVLRVGARGTAKLFGHSVPFAVYLFRRPLAVLRQQVGL